MRIKLFIIILFLYIHSLKAENYQPPVHMIYEGGSLEENNIQLDSPVKFSSSGINCFLRHTLNRLEYARDFLPNNFSHFLQFLNHGKKTKQTRTYFQSVFRLFTNKLKASTYINAYAFSRMLEQLPNLLEDYFLVQKSSIDSFKNSLNNILYETFLSKFSFFKENPELFFDELSQDIIDAVNKENQFAGDISNEKLRHSIMRFLELALSKLIWTPEDQDDTWDLVKTISTQLTKLIDRNIITDIDDLNDLFITLLERYCFFLELTGSDISVECYEKIKDDIVSHYLPLLEIEEQEEFLETKSEHLMRIVCEVEAKSRAREYGIIV